MVLETAFRADNYLLKMQYYPYVRYIMPLLLSLVLVSLANIQSHLKNPFDGVGEDDIKINVDQFMLRLYD